MTGVTNDLDLFSAAAADPRRGPGGGPGHVRRPGDAAVLLLHGSRDVLISPSQTQHLHKALLRVGADSTRHLDRS